ncbi:response regulator transcription factor [Brachybacterium aquaticum]|uniref:DNA-binding NarL/FixJ family response regulator n=1 Tax=Brachybacterium aquaticum TaxID=1432564 RepID=A0A841AIG4_9MICO|nr:LuxR C-terminal-related transcriptional regulator [Brachybacterium aquaticum]MBB5832834.1 DNA-binding NarL/FixJ family response regulator [Brachybacterium aquaticum]
MLAVLERGANLDLVRQRAAGPEGARRVEELFTSAERDVVHLVAQGCTNRAIARELYLSVRTVELRLTNVYRKARVRSGFELIRLLAEAGDEQTADAASRPA